jgi:hypothetical protein
VLRADKRLIVAAALLLGACRDSAPVEKRDANADAHAIADVHGDAHADTDASMDADASVDADASLSASAEDDSPYLTGTPRSAKAIGHTSVVFKVELSTGKKAVFKPASRRGPVRYKGEIAARRLAVALGLVNVPRAFFRVFEASALSGAAGAEEMIAPGGVVKGALMPWIDHLEFIALEAPPLSSEWKQWLRKGAVIPDDKRALAAQISTLVAFDFITANWDRWSGGNVGIARGERDREDKTSGTLLFIDNDGAFFDVPPNEGLQRNRKLLDGIDRFSRSFVVKLRVLSDDAIERALGEESPGVPLLSKKALDGVLARKRTLVEILDAKIGDAGAGAALAFP